MTIRNKLIGNVLVMTAIVVAISLSSFFSMRFLQGKLSYLTEKSTPLQMRSIELQRELQRCVANLVKVNAAQTLKEFNLFQDEADKSLIAVAATEQSLEKIKGGTGKISDALDKLALELFNASQERIKSSDAAIAANTKVSHLMTESSTHLKALEASIQNLQASYSGTFAGAFENTSISSNKLRSIEELRSLLRELQLLNVTVQNNQSRSSLLIAKGKLKAVAARIAKNDYYMANLAISAVTNGFSGKLAEYIILQTDAITLKGKAPDNEASTNSKNISYMLNDLFQTMDQETMLARDELALATSKQKNIYSQTNITNKILVTNSELVALGLMVTNETNRLFTHDSATALDKSDAEISSLFTKIQERVQTLESTLSGLNARDELKILRTAASSLAAIRTELYSGNGIIVTLRKKLKAIELATTTSGKLHSIVITQSARGNENVSTARTEQERAIATVNAVIKSSLTQISGIGVTAIIIGILFGFWIYRSVLLPLQVIQKAVSTQQEQVTEKAAIAEAVAAGDLSKEVTVSKTLTLDRTLIYDDEMRMVLDSVVGMNSAQVMFDSAFSGMTSSLRKSRDEDARRDRLKSGLYELNKILRGEHTNAELAKSALAFICNFLKAGVGVVYLYDEKTDLLMPLAAYAISITGRLAEGFQSGEGLAGQVALERKTICVTTVPRDYLPISSALGDASPQNVAIMPILHNETLVGVLELGSFRIFSEDDFDFLTQSLEGIAIAISINQSHQTVCDLLEQTQCQTEELRVQQEELQQTNDELKERTHMLKEQHKIL